MNNKFQESAKYLFCTLLTLLTFNVLASPAWEEAARSGDQAQIQKFLSEKPELLNWRNEKGFTALILSSYHQQRALTAKLLSLGADPCLTDNKGNTALMGVIFKGYPQLILDLVDKCDVNHQNKEGQTALMFAALFGREEVFKKLIKLGANRDLKDSEGRTALSLAEGQWNQMMVSLIKTFGVIKH